MIVKPLPAQTIDWDELSGGSDWDALLTPPTDPATGQVHPLRERAVSNNLDVPIEVSYDGTEIHHTIEAGAARSFDVHEVAGIIYVRAQPGTTPTTGDIHADGSI